QDYTCDTENINAYDDKYDNSFAESTKYTQKLPPSIHRQNTTRIHNKCRASTQSVEFTNAAVTKRLCLDDNLVENGMKLYQ
ncbi:1125_t:CDS:2, partial [Racocetra persica]